MRGTEISWIMCLLLWRDRSMQLIRAFKLILVRFGFSLAAIGEAGEFIWLRAERKHEGTSAREIDELVHHVPQRLFGGVHQ